MIAMINWYCTDRSRWMVSGDVQGVDHLRNIFTICENTRQVLRWLATREAEATE